MIKTFLARLASLRLRYIFIFFILSLIVLYPLLSPLFVRGIPWTYDGNLHQYRMAGFHAAVKEGQIPPRWTSLLSYGWGSPVLNFNWSLPYWMAEPFLFAGWSTTDAQKIVVASAIPFSYLSMFALLSVWLGFWPAITGASFYVWATFRIYLLYTSGASGMEIGFIFWPLLFLSVFLIEKRKCSIAFLVGSMATAYTMLSHQIMFLMIQPLFWSFVFIRDRKNKKLGILPRTVFFYTVGLLVSAYFWLPAIVEKQYIRIGETTHRYLVEFLSPVILFLQINVFMLSGENIWKYIYGTGWILFFVVGLSIVAILTHISTKKPSVFHKDLHVLRMLFIVFFFISLFFITPYSAPLWKIIPLLPQFIYPVRFQALALFCGSILAAMCIRQMKYAPVWSIICISFAMVLNMQMIPVSPRRTNWDDSYYTYGESTSDMYGEFLPKTSNAQHFFITPEMYERHEIGRIVSGTGSVTDTAKRSASASFTVQAKTDVLVVINQLYFPGWEVRANGKKIPVKSYGYGEMGVTLPRGSYKVNADFKNTPIRNAGNILSIFGAIILLGYVCAKHNHR